MTRESQYETRFKKWGFRKNLAKDDWRIVGYKTLKRARVEGKETEMLLDNRVFNQKKFKRQSTRYMSVLEMNCRNYGGNEDCFFYERI